MSMSSASQLESSLISVAGSDSTLASSSKFTTIGVPIGKLVIGVGAGGGGGGDYSRDGYYSRKYGSLMTLQ